MTPAELRALLAKATPGPWVAETDWFDCASEGIEAHVVSPGVKACFMSFPVDGTKFGHDDMENAPWTDEDAAKKRAAEDKARVSQELADAKLLAAAVNALPALLDVVEAAKETGHCCDHAANCCKEWCDSCQHFEKMNARFSTALAKLETP